jgi:Rrf2 family protein
MKLSTKSTYGLRALIDLAVYSEEEIVSISSIATRENISLSYLEQLVAKLKKAGLVVSIRGAGGGYQLAREASEISVGDILRALEGNLEAVKCPGLSNSCEEADMCVTKFVWGKINNAITVAVDEITLEQIVNERKRIFANGAKNISECQN